MSTLFFAGSFQQQVPRSEGLVIPTRISRLGKIPSCLGGNDFYRSCTCFHDHWLADRLERKISREVAYFYRELLSWSTKKERWSLWILARLVTVLSHETTCNTISDTDRCYLRRYSQKNSRRRWLQRTGLLANTDVLKSDSLSKSWSKIVKSHPCAFSIYLLIYSQMSTIC